MKFVISYVSKKVSLTLNNCFNPHENFQKSLHTLKKYFIIIKEPDDDNEEIGRNKNHFTSIVGAFYINLIMC